MSKIHTLCLFALLLAGQAMQAQTEAEEKAWIAYMTPGKEHQLLAAEDGTWTNEMTFWHDAKSEPMKAITTSQAKMIFDGRYQEVNYSGDVMGMPFQGKSIICFDNALKRYTSTWIDNMGTGMMVMYGTPGKDGKSIVFKGDMVNPVDGKTNPCREVYTIVDANTRKMEMYDSRNGKEWKSMEIIMKRK